MKLYQLNVTVEIRGLHYDAAALYSLNGEDEFPTVHEVADESGESIMGKLGPNALQKIVEECGDAYDDPKGYEERRAAKESRRYNGVFFAPRKFNELRRTSPWEQQVMELMTK